MGVVVLLGPFPVSVPRHAFVAIDISKSGAVVRASMETEWSIFFQGIVRTFMGANLEPSHGMTDTPRSNSFISGIIQRAMQGLFVASMDSMDRKRTWIRDNEFVRIYKHGPSPVFLSEFLGTSPNELVLSKTMTKDATFGQIFSGGREEIGIVPNGDIDQPSVRLSMQHISRRCP
jgi:hypothetical protein